MKFVWIPTLVTLLALGGVAFITTHAVAEHDNTCHPTTTTKMLLAIKTLDIGNEENAEFKVSALVSINSAGDTSAAGTAQVFDGRPTPVLVADSDSATAECAVGTGDPLQLTIVFHDVITGERGLLNVDSAGEPGNDGWIPARLTLSAAGGAQMDGAILVVSAADGPMP